MCPTSSLSPLHTCIDYTVIMPFNKYIYINYVYFHAPRSMLKDCGDLWTLASLEQDLHHWMDASGDLKQAKYYGNIVNMAMFSNAPDTLVLDILPPPELHLLLGPVNTIFGAMEREWPDASKWTTGCHVEKDEYHGGTFNGNACRKLLKNTELLQLTCPMHCLKYVEVFRAFKCVVDTCYGTVLHPDFQVHIQQFRQSFEALEISDTPKIHAVFFHVPQFCLKYACGLGRHSEQASESVHAHFKSVWANYIVPQSHPEYSARLLRAVKDFNCRRI